MLYHQQLFQIELLEAVWPPFGYVANFGHKRHTDNYPIRSLDNYWIRASINQVKQIRIIFYRSVMSLALKKLSN